jgi:hypothetical protein
MLAELPRRSSCVCPLGRRAPTAALPDEETEVLRRAVRLVCTSATFIGVWGRARRAAAAAAEDSALLGSWFAADMKADAAAVVAFGFALAVFKGCEKSWAH